MSGGNPSKTSPYSSEAVPFNSFNNFNFTCETFPLHVPDMKLYSIKLFNWFEIRPQLDPVFGDESNYDSISFQRAATVLPCQRNDFPFGYIL